jgi:hypothetical protein
MCENTTKYKVFHWEKRDNFDSYFRNIVQLINGYRYYAATVYIIDNECLIDIWNMTKHTTLSYRILTSNFEECLKIADQYLIEIGYILLSEEQSDKYRVLL